MNPQPLARAIAPALLTLLLTACGGGGGGGDTGSASVTGPSAQAPAAAPADTASTADTSSAADTAATADSANTADAGTPATTASSSAPPTTGGPAAPSNLKVFHDLKRYEFSWPAVEGATSYEILMDPDGPAGRALPIPVVTDIPPTQLQASMTPPAAWHGLDLKATFSVRGCAAGRCGEPSLAVWLAGEKTIGYLKGQEIQAGSDFGFAVALSADGNTLAVAAPRWKFNSQTGTQFGLVSIYQLRGMSWVEDRITHVTSSAPAFGFSLALSANGRKLAVGIASETSESGRVGLCHYLPASQTQEEGWTCETAFDGESGSQAGLSVGLSGNGEVLAVGAPGNGSVVILTAAHGIKLRDRFLAAAQPGLDRFGSQVALSADGMTLVATDTVPGEKARSGAVYVMQATAQNWSTGPGVTSPLIELSSAGSSVAISGNGGLIAVGVPQEKEVQMFARESTGYVKRAPVKAFVAFDEFGSSVALSHDGKTLAVGEIGRAFFGDRSSSYIHLFSHSEALGWQAVRLPRQSSGKRGIGAAAINDKLALPSLALSGDGKTLAVGDMDHPEPDTGILKPPFNYPKGGPSYGGVLLY
ncbi:hypothetical protein JI739_07105 [Ramlibacter sp. AW1]|uniref:Uncharacterized protein n=1 Tax=Ramlibacter aurantiacus TaxID=2801330 RepID=A0A937D5N9_9BURK|nr:hypothetical protein [Ramlibacter aurantiacus]MBL0420113.1 hypothetical protein [Ramlibacter aurantiacus]